MRKKGKPSTFSLFSGQSSAGGGLLILVSVVFMILSAVRPHSFDFMRRGVSDIFAPVLQAANMPLQKASFFLHGMTQLAQLQADNDRLQEENEDLRAWYQMALLLDSENKSLRDLLNLNIGYDFEHMSARVLSDAGNTFVKTVLIKIDPRFNPKKNASVLSGQGLVGRLVEIGNETARVLLVTDVNSRVPVAVEDTGQHAIMAGDNDGLPRLIHLPQESTLQDGARLVTSGYGGVFPYGLPVGTVTRDGDGTPRVALYAQFDRLRIVRVLLGQKGVLNGF